MDLVRQFREYTRQLECHLGNMNQSDCCCCGVSTAQCFILVEIGRKPSKEDRRYVLLNLLPKGQERFEKIENDMYIKFKGVFEQIPVEKREQVIEALKLYNEACTKVEEKRNEQ